MPCISAPRTPTPPRSLPDRGASRRRSYGRLPIGEVGSALDGFAKQAARWLVRLPAAGRRAVARGGRGRRGSGADQRRRFGRGNPVGNSKPAERFDELDAGCGCCADGEHDAAIATARARPRVMAKWNALLPSTASAERPAQSGGTGADEALVPKSFRLWRRRSAAFAEPAFRRIRFSSTESTSGSSVVYCWVIHSTSAVLRVSGTAERRSEYAPSNL